PPGRGLATAGLQGVSTTRAPGGGPSPFCPQGGGPCGGCALAMALARAASVARRAAPAASSSQALCLLHRRFKDRPPSLNHPLQPPPVLARAVGRAAGPRPWRRSCAGASRSPFEVLGLEASATQADVKRAYFELSKKCHPDVYDAPDALERFQEIGRAYTMLIDEELRRSYEAQAGIYQQGETSFQDLFDRIFRDKRLKDPSLAVEERALYAITEARKGNETPMRDFVVDYRLPPQLFLPPNPVLEARPGGGGGDEDLADDGTRNTINDLLSKSPISGGG
ncbi:unnamed protein product, partial [Prorocentrum cordatum]